jgi:glucokinase
LNGCWEVFCSGPAIRRRLAQHLASDAAYKGALTATSSIAELSAAAEQGDRLAHGVIDETAVYMARGLVNLICNFDPELVIMSGLVVWECPTLLAATQEALRKTIAGRNIDLALVAQSAEGGVIAASAIVSARQIEKLACA